jgi:hypothetical protein
VSSRHVETDAIDLRVCTVLFHFVLFFRFADGFAFLHSCGVIPWDTCCSFVRFVVHVRVVFSHTLVLSIVEAPVMDWYLLLFGALLRLVFSTSVTSSRHHRRVLLLVIVSSFSFWFPPPNILSR